MPRVRSESSRRSGATGATLESAQEKALVRMYCGFIGDCFLLRFPRTGGGHVHVMIDCGVLQGTPDASDIARRIMKDVVDTTGGSLDVLVVTHEHADHISGFALAAEQFANLSVDELWLAWTEDERDELAKSLRRGRMAALQFIERNRDYLAKSRLYAKPSPDADEDEEADKDEKADEKKEGQELPGGVDAFLGWNTGGGLAAAARNSADLMAELKRKARRVRYFEPGHGPAHVPGTDGISVYVLGPPRDVRLIRKSRPSHSDPEVYTLALDDGDVDPFFAAAMVHGLQENDTPSDDDVERLKSSLPFGPRHLNLDDLGLKAVGRKLRGTADEPSAKTFYARYYTASEQAWRRIDEDWLEAGGQLALRLDSDTNNTSLVLAFSLDRRDDRGVLLFPGDAQVGNWKSWHLHEWTEADGHTKTTANHLLARTILYKVGHHGSHNATLREEGLERMTHPELVAMIPVDEAFARDKKKWRMPFESLLKRLVEKTEGRVLRGDVLREKLLPELEKTRSGRDFLAAVTEKTAVDKDRLYVEYAVATRSPSIR